MKETERGFFFYWSSGVHSITLEKDELKTAEFSSQKIKCMCFAFAKHKSYLSQWRASPFLSEFNKRISPGLDVLHHSSTLVHLLKWATWIINLNSYPYSYYFGGEKNRYKHIHKLPFDHNLSQSWKENEDLLCGKIQPVQLFSSRGWLVLVYAPHETHLKKKC